MPQYRYHGRGQAGVRRAGPSKKRVALTVELVPQETLAGAIGVGRGDVVALVGAGGKTSALRLLAKELSAGGGRVLTTTTTAMFLREMTAVGPVRKLEEQGGQAAGLEDVLGERRCAAVVLSERDGGKVAGLSPATVDQLWSHGSADYLVVEADGSRGLPLKAFGPHEPQVPSVTTTIVLVAGLDALGAPLDEGHVHRAGMLASTLNAGRRIVLLLNKADAPDSRAPGLDIARLLLGRDGDVVAPGGAAEPPIATRDARPDAVVVCSLRDGRFAAAVEGE
jgi:probable selenium-dependent hydroxylase accessory protein YqeC